MTRIDDLQKKYPSIPKKMIVKEEILNRGVRDTADLDKVSDWTPATRSYQNKFDDVSLKEIVEKRPSRLRDGHVLRPRNLYMQNGSGAKVHISPRSPYEIRVIGYSEYFASGEQCKFCNFNTGQEDARSIGLNWPVTDNLEDRGRGLGVRGSSPHWRRSS